MRSLMPRISGNSDENHQHRLAGGGEVIYQAVNFNLGAHIHTARRLIEDHDIGICLQPLGEDHFLLIATGKISGELFRVR